MSLKTTFRWMILLLLFLVFATQGVCQETPSQMIIENNSFGVITDKNKPLVVFIQNNEGAAKYKVVFKEIVLGEGSLDLSGIAKRIQFGETQITIQRIAGNDFQVSLK